MQPLKFHSFSQALKLLAKIPNILTFLRLILAPLVFGALIMHKNFIALCFFCLASGSDWLDGKLARHYNIQSRLGTILDPVADKLLIFLTCFGLVYLGLLPLWLFVILIGRDLLILGFGLSILINNWKISFLPNLWGKITTALQLMYLFDRVVKLMLPHLPKVPIIDDGLVYMVALMTIFSGCNYLWQFIQQYPQR